MAAKLGGFQGSSNDLPKDVKSGNRTPRRQGGDKSIVKPSGDSASPTGGTKVTARRKANYGGSNKSVMQEMIGGPFGKS